MDSLKIKFGKRFRALRIASNYTQDTLCEAYKLKTGKKILKSSISQYENGKQLPEITDLITWSQFFNVTTDYLLGLSDAMFYNAISSIKDLEKILLKLSFDDRKMAKPYLEKLYSKFYNQSINNKGDD